MLSNPTPSGRLRGGWRYITSLACAILCVASSGSAFSQEVQATSGYYRYQNQRAPSQETAVANIPFGTGMLTNADTYTLVSWPGDNTIPYTILPIAVDLQRDAPLQRVVVHTRFPNTYWGISSIEVEARASADALYQVVAVVNQPGSNWTQLSIPTDGINARYVRIKLTRAHTYVYLGVAELQFFTSSSSAPLQTVTDLSLEFAKGIEERVTVGAYRYQKVPNSGETTATNIDFGPSAKLTDGSSTLATWNGSGSSTASPAKLSIVFDLRRDVPVQRLVLYTSFPPDYAIQEVTVETRPSSSETYQKPVSHYPADNNWTYLDLPLGGTTARYVRLNLVRSDSWKYVGLGEVQIYTSPSTLPLQVVPDLSTEFSRETQLVDKYGQFIWSSWPGKVTSDTQLVTEKNAEALTLPTTAPAGTDIYGGRIGPDYGPPRFFRLQNISGKWWFITPLGNKFYLNGLCDTSPAAWNYGTAVYKDDSATPQVVRKVFEELPSMSDYNFAYDTGSGHLRVNFLKRNLYHKYGTDSNYLSTWASVMQRRMWDWGFNANGKWEKHPTATLQVPFVVDLRPANGVVRIDWACDPFDPNFKTKVEEGVASKIDSNDFRANTWVLGLIFENEAGWDLEIIRQVMGLPATRHAKIALVDHLFANHTTTELTSAFGFTITAKSHLLNATPSTWPSSLKPTGLTFISQEAGPKYWSTVHAAIRRYDLNHAILGGALVPGWRSSFEWETSALPFVNAISLDYYNKNTSWYSAKGYAGLSKPVVLLEHGLVTTGHGRRPYANATTATNAERGAIYRHVVENLASYPNFIGASYFTLFDQALTGRNQGGGGENYNFGLLNQQDQPIADMVAHVRNTKFPRLYDVHAGTVSPYVLASVPPGTNPAGAYASWAAAKGLNESNLGPAQDPDGDGIVNVLEFVLGGDPLVASTSILPMFTPAETGPAAVNLKLKRTAESKGAVGLRVHYGTDLSSWTGIDVDAADALPDANGVTVSITSSPPAPDDVKVSVPLALAEDGRIFARLQADYGQL